IAYYISLPIIYGFAIMPFWLLYFHSRIFYVILFYIIGYRKEVVMNNLRNAFPGKKESELYHIRKEFYKYFLDLILETLKTLSVSESSLRKRLRMEDTSLFEKYYNANQSIIIAMGHLGNWELGGARFAIEKFHKLNVIYHPLNNEYFERLIRKMRMRLGNGLIAMKDTYRDILKNRNKLTATAFIADQTAPRDKGYWTTFLNQDTAVFRGTAKIAKKMDYPVVYASVMRTKRGHYEITLTELVENPQLKTEEEILDLFTKKLEEDIQNNPPTWLWTHKRWKHKKPDSIANA
ncbi:MAG: lysophospholipid acyltransferase family protein, partial [Flavobacteriales bacterium]|nr:lysophospholipid acyltransferase family protein [Flavobacteriales bacterium]